MEICTLERNPPPRNTERATTSTNSWSGVPGLTIKRRLTEINMSPPNERNWIQGEETVFVTEYKIYTVPQQQIVTLILKSVWVYGIQLWEAASTTNLEVLQRLQNKSLRTSDDIAWPRGTYQTSSYTTMSNYQKSQYFSRTVKKKSEDLVSTTEIEWPGIQLTCALWTNHTVTCRLKRYEDTDLPFKTWSFLNVC